jgi:hypothetical protein
MGEKLVRCVACVWKCGKRFVNARRTAVLFAAFVGLFLWTAYLTVDGLVTGPELLLVAAAATGALAASLWAMYTQAETVSEAKSRFYLDAFMDGLEQAATMLEDDWTNNRLRWTAAARILCQCEKIEPLITNKDHKNLVQIKRDAYRHRFGAILQVHDRDQRASFFCGASPTLSLDSAAELVAAKLSIGRPPNITETSLHVIWRFARFPDDYDEPLKTKFTAKEMERLALINPDLHEYLDFWDNHIAAGGQIHELPTPRQREGEPSP